MSSDPISEITALLAKHKKSSLKSVQWPEAVQGVNQEVEYEAGPSRDVDGRDRGGPVDVVRLRERVRALEDEVDDLKQGVRPAEVVLGLSLAAVVVAVLIVAGVWVCLSHVSWIVVLGATLVLLTVSIIVPACVVLVWRAASRT